MSIAGSVQEVGSAALHHKLIEAQINDYAAYAKLTLLLYEIMINLGREVKLVWNTSFRWSNLIYYMNRYPVVAFQIWSVCYSTTTPHCNTLYQFFWYASFIPTRAAITASFALRVYAIMEGRLAFVIILSALGLTIVGLDIWQGVQSSCTASSDRLSTITTFVFLACFDVLSTVLVTIRMIQTVYWSGGFRVLEGKHIAGYILRSGVLYFGVVTIPQLIAIALYFAPQSLYTLVLEGRGLLNNLMLVLASIMVARFLLDLREMNSGKVVFDMSIATSADTMPFEAAVNPALSACSDLRTRPRIRERHLFDDASLFKDFADQEVYTHFSSAGTSQFTISRKGNSLGGLLQF